MKTNGGSAPKPPGFIAFVLKARWQERAEDRPILLPTPGMALGSVPTVALSSTQVIKI
jgi:hypothetical protein